MKNRDNGYPLIKEISKHERILMVKDIFSTVTAKYDFLNHFLSMGRDFYWRRTTIKQIYLFQTNRLLDIATGTADLAIETSRLFPKAQVIGLDFVQQMLEKGQEKAANKNQNQIHFCAGDALDLPISNEKIDTVSIAFGIRNIPDITQALQEMFRVLLPGGKVLILETLYPENWFIKKVYNIYLYFLPKLARFFSNNPGAYYYLTDSILTFPTSDQFMDLMKKSGFTDVHKYKLTFGIAYLFTGIKPN